MGEEPGWAAAGPRWWRGAMINLAPKRGFPSLTSLMLQGNRI